MFDNHEISSESGITNCTVGMTQYAICNFLETKQNFFVSTYDITSCIVVLFKNINEDKICSHFGMAHINYANVYFPDVRVDNLTAFIDAFIQHGGRLETASIQIMGGQLNDPNRVVQLVKQQIEAIGLERSMPQLNVKVPSGFQLQCDKNSGRTGSFEVMALACNKHGTYTRKVRCVEGNYLEPWFNSQQAQLFLSQPIIQEVLHVDPEVRSKLLERTTTFYQSINLVLANSDHPTSIHTVEAIKQVCRLEPIMIHAADPEDALSLATSI